MQAFVIGIDVRSGDIVKRITKLVMAEDEVMAQLYAMESECHGTLGETANWEGGGIDDLGGELHYSLVSCQSVAPSELPALSNHLPLVKAPNRATEAEARVLVGIEEGFTEGMDQNHETSSQYAFAVSSGSSTGQRSQQKKFGSSAALRFMDELLDSVETLTGIADEYGARTLADLMYLQAAILEDGFIDYHPDDDSKVLELAQGLPSGEQWIQFIRHIEEV